MITIVLFLEREGRHECRGNEMKWGEGDEVKKCTKINREGKGQCHSENRCRRTRNLRGACTCLVEHQAVCCTGHSCSRSRRSNLKTEDKVSGYPSVEDKRSWGLDQRNAWLFVKLPTFHSGDSKYWQGLLCHLIMFYLSDNYSTIYLKVRQNTGLFM